MSNHTIYSVLELSTDHLSDDERDGLERGQCPLAMVYSTDYGWIVFAGDPEDEDEQYFFGDAQDAWAGLIAARKLARSLGCRLVEFDCDSPLNEALPVYED